MDKQQKQDMALITAGNFGASTAGSFILFRTFFKGKEIQQGYEAVEENVPNDPGAQTYPRTIDNMGNVIIRAIEKIKEKYPGAQVVEVVFHGGGEANVRFMRPMGVPI